MVDFKAPNHLMILISAKMNSPDYDDFIDAFNVRTPISPLPLTPVPSPSHEQYQDAIYDSLPPMEQFTVPESPLKDLLLESPLKEPRKSSRVSESPLKDPVDSKPTFVSKSPDPPVKKVDSVIHRSPRSRERRNEEIRNEEQRLRNPRMYKRPDFRPRIEGMISNPECFGDPPYAQQLMPTSQENTQVFFHSQGLSVLYIRNNGFTLTNGVVSYAMDRECPNEQFKSLHYINVGTICVNEHDSKQTFNEIQASWSSSSQFKRTPVMLLNSNGHNSAHILFESIKEDSYRRFTSVHDGPNKCLPEHISTTVVPVTLPEKPEALKYAARQGKVHACIIYQEPNTKRVFFLFCKDNWYQKRLCLRSRANPNMFRRSFEPHEQMLYHRMVLEPHTAYPIPAGTHYILLTVQKTVFGLDNIPETILLQFMENGFNLEDFRKMKRYDQKVYKLPPPTAAHVPAETNKRPLEEQPGPSFKRNRVLITPVIRPPVAPVLIARPSMALASPQPMSIPESPVLTIPQILVTDPPVQIPDPPELTTPPVQIPDPPVLIPVFQLSVHIPPLPMTPPVQLFLPDPPPVQIL
ncbi:uncharacterized protein TNCV_4616951 [Trichonephila clavipes]|nr:uncharacterized protein TNCV_4616951 [Trichonephila clavipes]